MGAMGVAILARKQPKRGTFDFDIQDIKFETVAIDCGQCPNNCEMVCILKDGRLLDALGNRCENGFLKAKQSF
jgi:hypothetical protein